MIFYVCWKHPNIPSFAFIYLQNFGDFNDAQIIILKFQRNYAFWAKCGERAELWGAREEIRRTNSGSYCSFVNLPFHILRCYTFVFGFMVFIERNVLFSVLKIVRTEVHWNKFPDLTFQVKYAALFIIRWITFEMCNGRTIPGTRLEWMMRSLKVITLIECIVNEIPMKFVN